MRLCAQSRLTSLMQQCDDLSYTQQLQRQEYEAMLISSQDRLSQVTVLQCPCHVLTYAWVPIEWWYNMYTYMVHLRICKIIYAHGDGRGTGTTRSRDSTQASPRNGEQYASARPPSPSASTCFCSLRPFPPVSTPLLPPPTARVCQSVVSITSTQSVHLPAVVPVHWGSGESVSLQCGLRSASVWSRIGASTNTGEPTWTWTGAVSAIASLGRVLGALCIQYRRQGYLLVSPASNSVIWIPAAPWTYFSATATALPAAAIVPLFARPSTCTAAAVPADSSLGTRYGGQGALIVPRVELYDS